MVTEDSSAVIRLWPGHTLILRQKPFSAAQNSGEDPRLVTQQEDDAGEVSVHDPTNQVSHHLGLVAMPDRYASVMVHHGDRSYTFTDAGTILVSHEGTFKEILIGSTWPRGQISVHTAFLTGARQPKTGEPIVLAVLRCLGNRNQRTILLWVALSQDSADVIKRKQVIKCKQHKETNWECRYVRTKDLLLICFIKKPGHWPLHGYDVHTGDTKFSLTITDIPFIDENCNYFDIHSCYHGDRIVENTLFVFIHSRLYVVKKRSIMGWTVDNVRDFQLGGRAELWQGKLWELDKPLGQLLFFDSKCRLVQPPIDDEDASDRMKVADRPVPLGHYLLVPGKTHLLLFSLKQ